MKRKDFNLETEIDRKYYPEDTTVGEIVFDIWSQDQTVMCAHIKILYETLDKSNRARGSITLSNVFGRISTYRRYKTFTKSILMKQFLISGAYMVKRCKIRSFTVYKIYLTDRDHLYDHFCEEKRQYMINLWREKK